MIFKVEKVMCLVVTALLILLQITCQEKSEVDVLCANDECTEPISEFKVSTKTYTADSVHKISAKGGEKGVILVKFKADDVKLVKVKIGEKEGYFPSNMIKELNILQKASTTRLSVPSELISTGIGSTLPTVPDQLVPGLDENILPNGDDPQSPAGRAIKEETKNESTPNPVENHITSNIDQTNPSVPVVAAPKVEQPNTKQQVGDSTSNSVEIISNLNDDKDNSSISENATQVTQPTTNQQANDSTSDVSINISEPRNDESTIKSKRKLQPPYLYSKTVTQKPELSGGKSKSIGEEIENNTSSHPKSTQEIEKNSENITIDSKEDFDNIQASSETNSVSESIPVANSASPEDIPDHNKTVDVKVVHEQNNETSQNTEDQNTLPNSSTESIPKMDIKTEEVIEIKIKEEIKNTENLSYVSTTEYSENNTAEESHQPTNLDSKDLDNIQTSSETNNVSKPIPVASGASPEDISDHNETVNANVVHEKNNVKSQNTEDQSTLPNSSTESIPKIDIKTEINDTEPNINSEKSSHVSTTEELSYSEKNTTEEPNQPAKQQITNVNSDVLAAADELKDTIAITSNQIQNELAGASQKIDNNDTSKIPHESHTKPPEATSEQAKSIENPSSPTSGISAFTEEIENATDPNNQPLPAGVEKVDGLINSTEDEADLSTPTQTPYQPEIATQSEPNKLSETAFNIPDKDDESTLPPTSIYAEPSIVPLPPVESTDRPHISTGFNSLPSFAANSKPQQIEPNENLSEKNIHLSSSESSGPDTAQPFNGESKPDIQSEPTTFSFDPSEKQGLNDFIHGSRKKVNENDVEEFETPNEKSVYETIQGYLPDLSIFQIDSILPAESIEKFLGIFDFGLSSQRQENVEKEFCSADSFCGTDRLNSFVEPHMTPKTSKRTVLPLWGEVNDREKEQIVWISGIISVFLFFIILVLFFVDNASRKNKNKLLISRINELENKLMVATKEIVSLQDQLTDTNSEPKEIPNVAETKRISEVYEHKINQYKKRIVELEDKVSYLEKELEDVSGSALEMHKLLEDSLTTQALSKTAIDEVETLRSLTECQEIQIDDLRKEINSIITENQCLKVDSEIDKSAIKKLEKECSLQTKKNLELSEKNRNLTLQLDKEIENSNTLESNYKSEIYQLRSKLEDIEMSLKRSEFQVQELNRVFLDKQEGKTAEEVRVACDEMQLKMQVSTLEAMNIELGGQLKEEKNARRMLEDHVGDIIKQLNNLKKTYETSEKERNEAVTKLQVLTQYFKDKEAQLRKEIEDKDKLCLERESKDESLSQKLASMREEISTLKTVNEELKKEIYDQETSFKGLLVNAEQKTREHWFALRQAERKYKECQQEAASLRNKILVLETNLSSINQKGDDKNNSGLNGDIPAIIPPMMYHPSMSPELLPFPSPSEFIPPPPSPIPSHTPDFFPPEPLYSPDERLPPLGGRRAPSPPPPITPDEDEFTPPPPDMKYAVGRSRNTVPPVPSSYSRRTPPPNSRHRPQYKSKPSRSSIDSPSSGMSLESLDKSGR